MGAPPWHAPAAIQPVKCIPFYRHLSHTVRRRARDFLSRRSISRVILYARKATRHCEAIEATVVATPLCFLIRKKRGRKRKEKGAGAEKFLGCRQADSCHRAWPAGGDRAGRRQIITAGIRRSNWTSVHILQLIIPFNESAKLHPALFVEDGHDKQIHTKGGACGPARDRSPC